ncbi:unnamed protein product [Cercospora beticola]|nr:unnamed protein product [Cercospora beticola]
MPQASTVVIETTRKVHAIILGPFERYQKRYAMGPDDAVDTMTAAWSEVAICSAHQMSKPLLYSELHSVALYQEQATGSERGRSRAARSQQQWQSQPNKLPSMTSGGPCETTSLRPSPHTKPSCVFFGDTASPTNHTFTSPADHNWQPDQICLTANSSEKPIAGGKTGSQPSPRLRRQPLTIPSHTEIGTSKTPSLHHHPRPEYDPAIPSLVFELLQQQPHPSDDTTQLPHKSHFEALSRPGEESGKRHLGTVRLDFAPFKPP